MNDEAVGRLFRKRSMFVRSKGDMSMRHRIISLPAAFGKWLARGLLAVSVATMLNGCGGDELAWTEDVQLPGGPTVTVKRRVEFKGPSHLGEPSTESYQQFEFRNPSSGEVVRWENTSQQGQLASLALWLNAGKVFLLTTPLYVGDEFKYNCPNPPYLLYEFVSGHWRSKPLKEIEVGRIRANMTSHPLIARERIEKNGFRLSAEMTADSYTYVDGRRKVPYIIRFDGMPEQTFATSNCTRLRNYLLSE
jgi:hypothetical protein